MELAPLVKIISDAGLGLGAIIALVIVVIMQMNFIRKIHQTLGVKMDANTDALKNLQDNIKENTNVTENMAGALESHREFLRIISERTR